MRPLGLATEGWRPVVAGLILGLVSFAYLLRFPPTLSGLDESYLLYGAKRVLEGQVLYRDFFDFVTPGSFYLYALAYAVGGVSITTARITAAALNSLGAACTYFLTLRVASTVEAVLAGLLVVVICVPVWNLASNHWMATALELAAAAVLLAPRWQNSARGRLAIAGALAGLVVCTNQTAGVWLVVWLAVTVPLLAVARESSRPWRRCARDLFWTAVGGAAACVPVLGYAVWRSSLAEFLYATHTWVMANYYDYNVGRMSWSGYNSDWADGIRYTYLWLFRSIPWLLVLESASVGWAIWRNGLRSQVVRVSLLLLALSACAAILYYPDVIHVAFVAPFAFIVIGGMIHRTHMALRVANANRLVTCALAGVFALVAVKGWSNVSRAWAENPVLYETAFGTLAGWKMRADTLRELREKLPMDGGTPRLFAYQNDAWIYLALPADNPTPFALLQPRYNTPAQIREAIDRLERDPRARVVVNLLGPEPDDPFMAYLRARFREVAGVGPVVRGGPVYRIFERVPQT